MLQHLHTLNLRGLPTSHLPLDRILHILSNNPELKSVSLHFQGVLPAILPLASLTLPHVTSLTLGGHYLLTQLLESLTLPILDSLTLDIEARDAIEDIISGLLTRSNRPPMQNLSIAYGVAANAAKFLLRAGRTCHRMDCTSGGASPPQNAHHRRHIARAPPHLLGYPEDDPNQSQTLAWACPALEFLGLRSCHAHNEGRDEAGADGRGPQPGQRRRPGSRRRYTHATRAPGALRVQQSWRGRDEVARLADCRCSLRRPGG